MEGSDGGIHSAVDGQSMFDLENNVHHILCTEQYFHRLHLCFNTSCTDIYIEGSRPEWCISTIYHAWDIYIYTILVENPRIILLSEVFLSLLSATSRPLSWGFQGLLLNVWGVKLSAMYQNCCTVLTGFGWFSCGDILLAYCRAWNSSQKQGFLRKWKWKIAEKNVFHGGKKSTSILFFYED